MWDKAVNVYDDLVAQEPDNKDLIRKLAKAVYNSDNPDRAKEVLQKLKNSQ